MKTPPTLPTPLFQVLSNPLFSLPCHLPPPPPHCSFCCLVSLAEWVIAPHLMCWLLYIMIFMDLHMPTPLFQVLSNPLHSLPFHLPPPLPLLFLLSCFFGWMGDCTIFDVPTIIHNDIYGSTHLEPWYLSTRRTLMCVLCNKTSSLLRSDT